MAGDMIEARDDFKHLPLPSKPTFGDRLINPWASEDNPTRTGIFVREFRRTGRLNPGTIWEFTDGNGKFWEINREEFRRPVDRLDGERQSAEDGDMLRCPFCGGEPVRSHDTETGSWEALCTSCGTTLMEGEEADLIKAWNTRLKAEQSDIRNAALEEAAMAAEGVERPDAGFHPFIREGFDAGKRDSATAIRALISQPNGGQT